MTRPRIRKDKGSAKAQSTLPAAKTARPPSTSHLRPKRSESGPARSCPNAKATKKLLNVRPSSWEETPRLAPICGKAGRMMFVASAPSAASPASRNRIPPVSRRSEGGRVRDQKRGHYRVLRTGRHVAARVAENEEETDHRCSGFRSQGPAELLFSLAVYPGAQFEGG